MNLARHSGKKLGAALRAAGLACVFWAAGIACASPAAAAEAEDGTVIAYRIELFRKKNINCDGSAGGAPLPPLTYSKELRDALEATAMDDADLGQSLAARGVQTARYRLFTVGETTARDAFNRIQLDYCPDLRDPYTHIGALFARERWWVIMATLAAPTASGASGAPAAPGVKNIPAATPNASGGGNASGVPGAPGLPSSLAPAVPAGSAASAVSAVASAAGASVTPGVPGVSGAGAAPSKKRDSAPLASRRQSPQEAKEAQAILTLVNELRAKGTECQGKTMPAVPALHKEPALERAAFSHALSMNEGRYFSTVSPEGLTLDKRAHGENYFWQTFTGLIAKGPPPASAVLSLWLNSPSQCQQLMDPLFSDAGVAVSDGYWVLLLAKPVSVTGASLVPKEDESLTPGSGGTTGQ